MVIKDPTMMQNAKYVLCQGQKSRSSDIVWTRDDEVSPPTISRLNLKLIDYFFRLIVDYFQITSLCMVSYSEHRQLLNTLFFPHTTTEAGGKGGMRVG